MKSKKLLVFLIMFIFIAVLVVLNSTLFTLQYVSVTWLTSTNNLKYVKESDLTSLVDVKGDSIFLLNKNEIASKLEKKFSYLRVVGIETKFPNKIVIYSAEREDLYALKLSDGDYAIIDDYGKVIQKTSTLSVGSNGDIDVHPIEVAFGVYVDDEFVPNTLNISDFVVGEQIKAQGMENILVKLSTTLKEANYTTLAKKGIFESIRIVSTGNGGEYKIELDTRNGMVIELLNAEDQMTDKFMMGLQVYKGYQQASYFGGTIVVLYSAEEGGIISYFNKNVNKKAV